MVTSGIEPRSSDLGSDALTIRLPTALINEHLGRLSLLQSEQRELTNPDRCSHSSFSLQSLVHPPRVAASRLAEPKSL
ncbi:hypothetical protein TNCV_962131 [Trichonephila clavipes]|nr:hypothetical protein TNCV_962131 [Trichonephila clavipes]